MALEEALRENEKLRRENTALRAENVQLRRRLATQEERIRALEEKALAGQRASKQASGGAVLEGRAEDQPQDTRPQAPPQGRFPSDS